MQTNSEQAEHTRLAGAPGVCVSIVIPAYNAARTIADGVTAAMNQLGLPGASEVIVVDDGSTDETASVARGCGARCVSQPNGGPASSRNTGFRAARGRYVLFTDSDCVPDPHWAERLIAPFGEERVGACGGSYTMANDGVVPAGIHWEIITRHRRFGSRVRALGSYNLAVRRDVLEAVGGFDETYLTASGEDNDLSYRISSLGYELRWVPEATVGHHHTRRLGKYLREQYRHGYFRAKLYRRHRRYVLGDDYTTVKDPLECALAGLSVVSAALVWVDGMVWALLGTLGLLLAVQVPTAVRMVRLSGRASVMLHVPVMFLRAFARTAGFCVGMLRRGTGHVS